MRFFDGKKLAVQKELELRRQVVKLKKKGITPKLVSVVVGDEEGAKSYQVLKRKAAERIGAELEIVSLDENATKEEILKEIEKANKNENVHGVMIQLPLPESLKPETGDLINKIDPEKDVDGMRDRGPFLAPVVKAILLALREASKYVKGDAQILVIGAGGFVGSKVVRALKDMDYSLEEAHSKTKNLKQKCKDADIIISAVGRPNLISADMVREGVGVIDAGAPEGDVDFGKVVKKAGFITPVPGGIGPLNVSFLLENLVEAAGS